MKQRDGLCRAALGVACCVVVRNASSFLTQGPSRVKSRAYSGVGMAKGFGERSIKKDTSKDKRESIARTSSLKILPKQNPDGKVQFNNPGVGDFQVFDSLVEYPGNFDLKIIGVNEGDFVGDIRRGVAGCLTEGEDGVVECSTREKGKYLSITLKVHVLSSDQLYKCYEAINKDPRVKFKF
ncbi:unnamed protein product [Discosporangium mesarthrocarpum]